MDEAEQQDRALADLRTSETVARHALHHSTNRALLYYNSGAIDDFDAILEVLDISRATWYRRVTDLDDCGCHL
jgi:hypothetical protein